MNGYQIDGNSFEWNSFKNLKKKRKENYLNEIVR